MQRDGWQCQLAKARGQNIPAVTVHHIFPRSEYPEYQWCEWNLISLSCEAHNLMHDRDSDRLSDRGRLLMLETAAKKNLDTGERTTLVIGMPQSGKTTYVKSHLKAGVVYDLDALAGALRLKAPKADTSKAARWIANSLLPGFTKAAHRYAREVWVIRTAPTIEEIQDIEPSRLIVLYGGYGNKNFKDERRQVLAKRIQDGVKYCKAEGIEVEEIDRDY